jgi:long-subunit acyl-CoA synthetase (AMP-forming)
MLFVYCCPGGTGDMSGGRWGPFWDKLVFSKVKERVGGEVKYMTTGEAPAAAAAAAAGCSEEIC